MTDYVHVDLKVTDEQNYDHKILEKINLCNIFPGRKQVIILLSSHVMGSVKDYQPSTSSEN